jgi:transcriptional regulator with XRE-family HTH domain
VRTATTYEIMESATSSNFEQLMGNSTGRVVDERSRRNEQHRPERMKKKTFGQVLTEARKRAGLTQKEVAERLRRQDGRPVDAPYLNAVEHDRRRPPPDYLIEQLAKIIGISADVLFFQASRIPSDVRGDIGHEQVEAAYEAFRKAFTGGKSGKKKG